MKYKYNPQHLKELRQSERIGQKQLADLLDVSIRHLSRFENGDCKLTHQMIIKYSEVFNDFDITKLYIKENDDNE